MSVSACRPPRPALALSLALGLGAANAFCQTLVYVEPGVATCPASPAAVAVPKPLASGVPVPGRIVVSCGLDQGSYTVAVGTTDPRATITPRTFVVNFGRLVGDGRFVVTFATPGRQSLSTAITANMGSPAPRGGFVGAAVEFDVAASR